MKNTRTAWMLLLLAIWSASQRAESQTDAISERARKLHFSSLVLDTHIDTTLRVRRPDWDFTAEHGHMPPGISSRPESNLHEGHVDLPRIKEGGLGALFFGIVVRGTITGPAAVNAALEQIAAIHKLAEDLPNEVAFCVTSSQVRLAFKERKIAALLGMEGGHMLNNSLPILRMYAKLGVRYITLTHFYHTDWADSSGEPPRHNGLTALGKEIVGEMNRLGVLVDISHVSDKTFWDALEVSRAPLIASHSSCRALSGHVRNMTDEMIRAMAKKGGVIQINYNTPYLDNAMSEYWLKTQQFRDELLTKYPGDENEIRRQQETGRQFGPSPKVNWEKIVEHIDHVARIAGVDHVGLGSDFDGATMPDGMEDVSQLPKITDALLRRNYTEADIKKILGENTLRVMAEAERIAALISREKRGSR